MSDMDIYQGNNFYSDVKEILHKARENSYKAINSAMVDAYWQIGMRIVEEEQNGQNRAGYGDSLIKNLSKFLVYELGKGFSVANLKNFRQFYITFKDDEKSYTLCSFLSWSHIRLIMRLEKRDVREYYLNESREQNWSVRLLQRNIKSGYYQRLLSTQKEENPVKENKLIKDHLDFIKDPYILEFLGLSDVSKYYESTLEQAIISNLQKFLLELGKGFSFVGRQFRISTETSHFFLDLVFYNYILKCFVIIDLKTGKLTHQDIGQMDMYVRMFDDLKRGEDDNPTIGIILCTDKDETIVKYSVLKENEHIFASKYKTVLPTEEELSRELENEKRYLLELRETKPAYRGEEEVFNKDPD
ncbi:MAG: PDDEXK nuclease domain-containing protein [Spirochaetaceae bacterium]|jgi:predicted nuclease of restriction endonuclease-like (RecB) superfamily|nr:PDDEXK nuclease domain-containing protein [Spirochaetaceae bacterium]